MTVVTARFFIKYKVLAYYPGQHYGIANSNTYSQSVTFADQILFYELARQIKINVPGNNRRTGKVLTG